MADYTPRAGDLARDHDGEIWFIYGDCDNPTHLYGIGPSYRHRSGGIPVRSIANDWGPLRLEYRPA